jgi:hypothetical protein
MLEVAAEREKEAEVLQIAIDAMEKHDKAFKELAAIEAAEREEVAEFLDVMAEEAFSNLGEQDFFEPPQSGVVPPPTGVEFKAIPPAPTVAQPPKPPAEPLKLNRQPRYLLRNTNTARYRRG